MTMHYFRDVVDAICHPARKVYSAMWQIQYVTQLRLPYDNDVFCVTDDVDVDCSDVVAADSGGDHDDVMCMMSIIALL